MQVDFSLGDEYVNIRPLNEGGMGTLFRAYRKGLDVEVVIKRVKSKFIGKLDQKSEANILKLLKHRYLPRIYDIISSEDGYVYTIMDFIPGENMQQYVRDRGVVDQRLAHKWALQLCEVTAYLHEQTPPIIHCDIKPSNLMITPTGDICLIDFNTSLIFSDGILALGATDGYAAPEQYTKPEAAAVQARQIQSQRSQQGQKPFTASPGQESGAMVMAAWEEETLTVQAALEEETLFAGTPPAQRSTQNARSQSRRSFAPAVTQHAGAYGSISKRTDIYGIGATLYYLVSGRTPEKSLKDVTPLETLKPHISRIFMEIILRAMQKEQDKRFADAGAMLSALESVAELDIRYQKYRFQRQIITLFFLLVFTAGAASAVYGAFSLRAERSNSYLTLVSQGSTFSEEGDYEQAAQTFERAIQMSPSRSESYISYGTMLYSQGRYQEGYDLIRNALNANILSDQNLNAEERGNLYYLMANCSFELEKYEAAEELFAEALQNIQNNSAIYRGYAITLARREKLDQAQEVLSRIRQMGANSEDYEIVQAEISYMQGDTEEALKAYLRVLQTTRDTGVLSRAYLSAAQLYNEKGQLDQEIELLEDAQKKLGKGAVLHISMLAEAYSQKAEQEQDAEIDYNQKAIDLLAGLIDRGQGTILTRLNLAVLLENVDQLKDAEKVLQELCADYPGDYRAYMRLSYLYMDWQTMLPNEKRDYTKCKEYYELAVKYYQTAKANGREDLEMIQLESMIQQLYEGNWF